MIFSLDLHGHSSLIKESFEKVSVSRSILILLRRFSMLDFLSQVSPSAPLLLLEDTVLNSHSPRWPCPLYCNGNPHIFNPCTNTTDSSPQVLIWTGLAGGDSEYCAILVAINSLLQIVLFAPLALLFIKVISRAEGSLDISYSTVAKSVAVFLGIPLAAAIITRFTLRKLVNEKWYDNTFLKYLAPWSLIGLLFTILILFASQGHRVVHQIVSVVRVAAPLIVYFAIIFFATLLVTYRLGFGYKVSATQSFTAASNNFELAIAVAVATFGVDSDQALAATVGPLIEVPVLLGLVYVVRWIGKRWGWKD